MPLIEKGEKLWLLGNSLEEYRRKGIGPDLFQAVVREVETEERIRQKLQAFRKHEGKRFAGKGVRPCISAALQNPDLTHKMKVAVVAEYHRAGLSQGEIEALFATRPDYEARRTKYQVNHIMTHGYSPFRCSTIQALGFCLPSCPRKTEKCKPEQSRLSVDRGGRLVLGREASEPVNPQPGFDVFAKAKADGLAACPLCESRGKPMFFANQHDLLIHVRRVHGCNAEFKEAAGNGQNGEPPKRHYEPEIEIPDGQRQTAGKLGKLEGE